MTHKTLLTSLLSIATDSQPHLIRFLQVTLTVCRQGPLWQAATVLSLTDSLVDNRVTWALVSTAKLCCFECPCYERCTIQLVPFFWVLMGIYVALLRNIFFITSQLDLRIFCTKCPNQYKNKRSLQQHIVDAHSVIMARYLEDRNMSCSMRKCSTILTNVKSYFYKKEFRTKRS